MRHIIPFGAGERERGDRYVDGVVGGGIEGGSSFIVVVRRVFRFLVDMLNKAVMVLYMLLLLLLVLLLLLLL